MSEKEFRALSKPDQELYILALMKTRDYLKWVGTDMHDAADEVDGLIGWFEYLKNTVRIDEV